MSAQRYGGINGPGIHTKRVTSKDLVKGKFLHYSPAKRMSCLFLLSIPLFQPTQSEQALVWLNLVQMVLMVGIGLLSSEYGKISISSKRVFRSQLAPRNREEGAGESRKIIYVVSSHVLYDNLDSRDGTLR